MHPGLIPVTSSNVAGYQYLSGKSVLLVAFKSGGTYSYDNVPPSVWSNFRSASSKGKFFNSDIEGRYAMSKLDDADVASLLGGSGASTASAKPTRRKTNVSLESLILRHPILAAVF